MAKNKEIVSRITQVYLNYGIVPISSKNKADFQMQRSEDLTGKDGAKNILNLNTKVRNINSISIL